MVFFAGKTIGLTPHSISDGWTTTGITVLILGLLAIPIVVLTTLSLIIRSRKSGKLQKIISFKI